MKDMEDGLSWWSVVGSVFGEPRAGDIAGEGLLWLQGVGQRVHTQGLLVSYNTWSVTFHELLLCCGTWQGWAVTGRHWSDRRC